MGTQLKFFFPSKYTYTCNYQDNFSTGSLHEVLTKERVCVVKDSRYREKGERGALNKMSEKTAGFIWTLCNETLKQQHYQIELRVSIKPGKILKKIRKK